MWASLKADMNEFVTTVKTETTEKLNVLDAAGLLDGANDERNDGAAGGGGAMIDLGTGNMIIESGNGSEGNTNNRTIHTGHVTATSSSSSSSSSALPSKEKMLQYLQSCEAVFQDPLSVEEEAGMENFNLDDKTQEISQLLEANPRTLQATFVRLTSEVEYADFWKRYYCRLGGDGDDDDETKIGETFDRYREEEPEPSAAAAAGTSALSSVTNFFGVAVARLVDEEGTGEAIAPSPFFNRTGEASAKSALGFLTGGGRPPFVLNTALSDDDGQMQQREESEDEEELGWDEDSDDEDGDGHDDEEDDDDDDDGSEVVMEFKDTEKEALKEKLEQTTEERNQLQNTIEMQAAEIKELKVKITNNCGGGSKEQAGDSSALASASSEAFQKDLEDLKVQLFEREAEIAGLKLKMEDDKLENTNQEEEVAEQVQAHLEEKDKTIASLQAQLDALNKQNAGNSDDALLERSRNENRQLRESLANVKQLLQEQESKCAESAQDLEKSQAKNQKLNERVQSLLKEATAGAANLDTIVQEKETLVVQLEGTKTRQASLEQELEATKALLQQTQAELETKTQSSTDDSQSTGIKVDSPDPEPAAAEDVISADGEDDGKGGDDWGDDW